MTYEEAVAVINLMGYEVDLWKTSSGNYYSDVLDRSKEWIRNSAQYLSQSDAKAALIRWVEDGAKTVADQSTDADLYGHGLKIRGRRHDL